MRLPSKTALPRLLASVLIITDSVFTHAFQDELLLFLIVAALLQADSSD